MNYKEYYKENINRKFCDINGIKEVDVKIKSNPIQTLKDNWIIVLGIVALIIGLLLVKFNLMIFGVCIAFVLLFVMLFLIGNRYSVVCEKDGIQINQYFQSIHVPYKSVKNVFIERTSKSLLMRTYVLVIRCEDKLSLLREFEFPLLCLKQQDLTKFVENFTIAEESDESTIKADKRRSLKRIVNSLFTLTCVIIIAWFLLSKGIIKLS